VGYSPPSTPKPIQIFISSDSEEFAELRKRLEDCINTEYMYNEQRTLEEDEKAEFVHQGIIMKAILVERGSEESFEESMKAGIDAAQIYVGIFGNQYSEPTRKEYDYARQLGLPLLVYYFTDPPKVAKGSHSRVVRFLKRDVQNTHHVHIRGNYRKIEAREFTELIDIILSDLASKAADMVREAIAVRRMLLEKTPDSVIGVILRARKTVFD
jgi:hypothetical protein